MLGTEKYIIGVFAEIIASQTVKAANGGTAVNYLYGPGDDIVSAMRTEAQGGVKVFPLIALIYPLKPHRGARPDMECTLKDLHLLIAVAANKEMKVMSRYDYNYKTTLYPLYEALINAIAASAYFLEVWPEKIIHDVEEAPNYAANDFVDALEIKNMTLNLFKNYNRWIRS